MADTEKFSKQQEHHQQVAAEIIAMLKKGTAPWQKPWKAGKTANTVLPMNGFSKRRYNGINLLYLYCVSIENGYTDNRWYSFNQVKKLGGKVKKGAKGVKVEYWQWEKKIKDKDEKGNEIEVTIKLEVPHRQATTVFNVAQLENIPEFIPPKVKWEPIERAENILAAVNVPIYHDQADRNYYVPKLDEIHLTPKNSFPTTHDYYSTALHELSHATGHESRLNRDTMNKFGSEAYAREELRAEIASFMLCAELGISQSDKHKESHVAYVGSWIKALQENPKEIFDAAKDSEKICNFLYEKEKEYMKNKEEIKAAEIETQKRLNAIETFSAPARSLLPHELYLSEAQKQLKATGIVNNEKIAEKLLDAGVSSFMAKKVIYHHSPEKNLKQSFSAVNRAMDNPKVKKSMQKINEGR